MLAAKGLRALSRTSQQVLSARSAARWTIPGLRLHSTDAVQSTGRTLTDRSDEARAASDAIAARKAEEPAYQMTFTCKECQERSSHRITKQAYHHGTVLVTCPGCKNRHLIADHMKIFSDKKVTLEDIMREKGEYITKGALGADGDIEFYDGKAAGVAATPPAPP
ncbi:hypothetical protein B0A48_03343 [Cryoendolithus antarcticus]|uniref:DNL-type domain-containing protein n=1 Tax=Cryoendolithus antarcticus TaxID=1507870 RepID=A0A1V8TJR3_9PEZI|nr:hypothetical protein B0A48_03343 [Cryoendolithus antarcticus]